ncbi:ATP-grasp domain-containing protein, partial [Akkermansiaceae bacterium]|nr:ATP-grasp domain-containing protein [Akkermansiaceae bacterium]
VENCGFKARPHRSQGTFSKYSSIDDKIDDLHFYTTFLKFGIGRASYDASQEISTPSTILIENIGKFNKLDKESFQFPLIIKPRVSCLVQNQRIISTKVKKVTNYEELEMQIRLNVGYVDILIQEYIEGFGRAVNFLSIKGAIRNQFQYERLHEPGFGGGSSLRKSIEEDVELRGYSRQLIGKLDYTGIGMIEYRYNPSSRKYYIMEINARFWGSLSLPVFCGINYPVLLHDYCVKGLTSKVNYATEKYSKNILKDSKWLFLKLKRLKVKIVFNAMKTDLIRFFNGDMTFDVEKSDDIRPFLKQYWSILTLFSEKCFRKIHEVFILMKKTQTRKLDRRKAFDALSQENKKVVFVCRGNIIRSAFAEKYYNTIKANGSYSCGSLEKSKRLSPIKALEAASEYNIDLETHNSLYLNDLDIESSQSIFFVMDAKQYKLLKVHKNYEHVYFLGVFDQRKSLVIKDPYHKPHDIRSFSSAFKKIKQNIDLMLGK